MSAEVVNDSEEAEDASSVDGAATQEEKSAACLRRVGEMSLRLVALAILLAQRLRLEGTGLWSLIC